MTSVTNNSHVARGSAGFTSRLRCATVLVILTALPMCLARIGGMPDVTNSIVSLDPGPIVAGRYLGKSDSSKKKSNFFEKKSDKKSRKDKKSKKDNDKKSASKSDKSSKKKKPKNLEIETFAREVVSILKDRKDVVNGKDKSKGLYPKELRKKVFNEFNVNDGNGDAKNLFDDALKKLEKKGEVVINDNGKVK